jgi:hypothetical protein
MAQGRHAWPALGRRPVQGRAGDVASGRSVRLPGLEQARSRGNDEARLREARGLEPGQERAGAPCGHLLTQTRHSAHLASVRWLLQPSAGRS